MQQTQAEIDFAFAFCNKAKFECITNVNIKCMLEQKHCKNISLLFMNVFSIVPECKLNRSTKVKKTQHSWERFQERSGTVNTSLNRSNDC